MRPRTWTAKEDFSSKRTAESFARLLREKLIKREENLRNVQESTDDSLNDANWREPRSIIRCRIVWLDFRSFMKKLVSGSIELEIKY